MRRVPASALLYLLLVVIATLLVVHDQRVLFALNIPPLFWLLSRRTTRYLLLRRLLLVAPLAGVAVGLRWLEHGPACWAPLLRIAGAGAWSTWLSAERTPRELERALAALGMPRALLELFTQTRRFSGQLLHTSREAWAAAVIRGGLLSARASARLAGLVAGVIVVRAFDRAEHVAVALVLRGAHFTDSASARGARIEIEEVG